MSKAAWAALVEKATDVMRPELVKLRNALIKEGLPLEALPTPGEVSAGGKVLGGILAASPYPDMGVYSGSDREAGEVASDVVRSVFPKVAADPITITTAGNIAGLLSAARHRVKEHREAAEKLVRDVERENDEAQKRAAVADALRDAALAERDARDAEEDAEEAAPLFAPPPSRAPYEERVEAMIEYLDDRDYDDLLDEADARGIPRGTFSKAVFSPTTSVNEKKREKWIRTLAMAMVNAQDVAAHPAPSTRLPEVPSARQKVSAPKVSRVLVSADDEDDLPSEEAEEITGQPGHVSSGRSERALARLRGFERHVATSRWYVGGVKRTDIKPSDEQIAACAKDVLIFTFGPDIDDAGAQVWIKGCLTDTFLPTQGRSGFKTAVMYVRKWLGLNEAGKPKADAKKSRLACRVLAASYGTPSAVIGDGLVLIREAPKQAARELVPLDLKAMAEEAAAEFGGNRRNNPRGGDARYADVLRTHGARGFAIPQKAPYVGSFPLYPISRARFALAVVASPIYDNHTEVRNQVIRSAVREHPELRAEARSVSETVKNRSSRRR